MHKTIADSAEAVVARRLTLEEFIRTIPDELWNDPLIEELIDVFEHEPPIRRILGVSESEHAQHMARAMEIIQELRGK